MGCGVSLVCESNDGLEMRALMKINVECLICDALICAFECLLGQRDDFLGNIIKITSCSPPLDAVLLQADLLLLV